MDWSSIAPHLFSGNPHAIDPSAATVDTKNLETPFPPKKSFTAAEGRDMAPQLEKVVAKYLDSPQKAEMENLLDKLATSGWNEAETKQFDALRLAAPQPPDENLWNIEKTRQKMP